MNKIEIREYLEKIYKLEIESVNTVNVVCTLVSLHVLTNTAKKTRVAHGTFLQKPDYKLAYVTLVRCFVCRSYIRKLVSSGFRNSFPTKRREMTLARRNNVVVSELSFAHTHTQAFKDSHTPLQRVYTDTSYNYLYSFLKLSKK